MKFTISLTRRRKICLVLTKLGPSETTTRLAWLLGGLALSLLIIFQPLLISSASAQTVSVATQQNEGSQIAAADTPDTSLNNLIDGWTQLDWIGQAAAPVTNTTTPNATSDGTVGQLALDPTDEAALLACQDPSGNCKIDLRVINYLTNLVTPGYLGGQGMGYIQASILRGYDTTGIGQYDRMTLAANPENPSTPAAESTGQAVDVSEVGQVTCKAVEHRLIGGSTTLWQPALPVKVAWQSSDGISKNPTPTGNSLVGVASNMSAQGIVQYLNSTGQLDQYVDYAKGMDLATIAKYVGANILMKDLGSAQITSDPLAGNVILSLGTGILQQQIPSLPSGLNAQDPNTDIRQAAGEAQFENALGLPSGSLAGGFGWNNILTSVGKRVLEQDFGLQAGYLNSHSLQDLNASSNSKAVTGYVSRNDDALNVVKGTIAAIQKNDNKGLELAAVNLLTNALKLSTQQKQNILDAVNKSQAPSLNGAAVNTGSLLSANGIEGLFATNATGQSQAANEFRQLGISIFQKALGNVVPSQFTGLTQSVINNLLNPGSNASLSSIALSVGGRSLFSSSDVDLSQIGNFITNPAGNSAVTSTIAGSLNSLLSLSGAANLSSNDVVSLMKGDYSALAKIGGAELAKAFNWNIGTGVALAGGQASLQQAMGQTFANGIATILGLKPNSNLQESTTMANDLGPAIVADQLGLDQSTLTRTTSAADLAKTSPSAFQNAFGVSSVNNVNWDDSNLNEQWLQDDVAVGASAGTTKSYLEGTTNNAAYSQSAVTGSIGKITPDQINDQFGLTDPGFQLPKTDGSNPAPVQQIINYVLGASKLPAGLQTSAANWINKLVGNGVDSQANFNPGDFATYFTSSGGSAQTNNFIDMGLRLFGKSLGASSGLSQDQTNSLVTAIKDVFNDPGKLTILENAREQYDQLGIKVLNGSASQTEIDRYKALGSDPSLTSYNSTFNNAADQLLKATGIPAKFRIDAENFLTGDWQSGLAQMAFVSYAKIINQNLPANDQLTYDELRVTLGLVDPVAINQQLKDQIAGSAIAGGAAGAEATLALQLRQDSILKASQGVQYQVSDSFLRKADPNIPAGFSAAMFAGTSAQKTQSLEDFAFNTIDQALKKINPAYQPGSLEAIYKGGVTDPSQILLSLVGNTSGGGTLGAIIAKAGVSVGPINPTDLGNLVTYFAGPKTAQNILTDPKFASTWSNFNNWLASTTGIKGLPPGLGQSLFVASQNNWNFDANIKNASGQILVPSINSLASGFVTSQITSWADAELRLPLGSTFRVYTAINNVVKASQALQAAELSTPIGLGGTNLAVANAQKGLSQAQAGLAVVVITTALNACATCQHFFATIDQALHAPVGFTNAVVAAAIASAFGLGPAGFYVAAAIYLFGVNSVSYICPTPPLEQFGQTAFDSASDQLTFGYAPGKDGPAIPTSSPAVGQSPFDWDNGVPFSDGNNSHLWEGWSRYYVGKLLQATMDYGAVQQNVNQPLQVLTYRQANVEFFAPQALDAFGSGELDNPYVGMGFTQNSTKVTNLVHVSFGGLF